MSFAGHNDLTDYDANDGISGNIGKINGLRCIEISKFPVHRIFARSFGFSLEPS